MLFGRPQISSVLERWFVQLQAGVEMMQVRPAEVEGRDMIRLMGFASDRIDLMARPTHWCGCEMVGKCNKCVLGAMPKENTMCRRPGTAAASSFVQRRREGGKKMSHGRSGRRELVSAREREGDMNKVTRRVSGGSPVAVAVAVAVAVDVIANSRALPVQCTAYLLYLPNPPSPPIPLDKSAEHKILGCVRRTLCVYPLRPPSHRQAPQLQVGAAAGHASARTLVLSATPAFCYTLFLSLPSASDLLASSSNPPSSLYRLLWPPSPNNSYQR
ncbi:hypothetical protein IWZ03DRAFT_107622 [Phyllosticta citriasiana]|uniref:Uncharacterized protein n=1 Tax=Phyllosticta citriasiana TaxID=595635 RepID=A0ABR1KV06_9PEZI